MKKILIKISGELLSKSTDSFDAHHVTSLINQIKKLQNTCHVSLLIGGGNFFRGEQHGLDLGLELSTAHHVGMVATMMNGLILQELMAKAGLDAVVMNSFSVPALAEPINKKTIQKAMSRKQVIIFTGGTGNPYFTTDTAAVIRSLQVDADELWKATKVDGVYDRVPSAENPGTLLPRIPYEKVLVDRLQIMDLTAITLAQKHAVTIRVFNLFTPDALLHAHNDSQFGSIISDT